MSVERISNCSAVCHQYQRHTNFVGAVVLIVGFAILAFQAGRDLSAHTDAVADLDRRHLVTDFDGLANDFVADAEG